MKTIRDELKRSLNTIDDRDHISITFPYFLQGIAAVITYVAWTLAEKDYPDLDIFGATIKGKANEKAGLYDTLSVINGYDFIRHTELNTELWLFLDWFLGLPAETDEDDMLVFCNHDYIAKKWNEYQERKLKKP